MKGSDLSLQRDVCPFCTWGYRTYLKPTAYIRKPVEAPDDWPRVSSFVQGPLPRADGFREQPVHSIPFV